MLVLMPSIIEPINDLKVHTLKNHNPRIHAEEVLIALAIQASNNPLAEIAIKQLPLLNLDGIFEKNDPEEEGIITSSFFLSFEFVLF